MKRLLWLVECIVLVKVVAIYDPKARTSHYELQVSSSNGVTSLLTSSWGVRAFLPVSQLSEIMEWKWSILRLNWMMSSRSDANQQFIASRRDLRQGEREDRNISGGIQRVTPTPYTPFGTDVASPCPGLSTNSARDAWQRNGSSVLTGDSYSITIQCRYKMPMNPKL